MWALLIFLFLYPGCESLICPPDTGPVFLLTEQHSDRNNHCFDYCGKTNCSVVFINPTGCVALNRDDLPSSDSRAVAVHKHCVQNVKATQIVFRESSRVLVDHTEKIEQAMNEFHCLSLCAQQSKFLCRSLMFYHERGECLMNSANTDTADTTKDTEGYEVTYMERRLPGDVPCTNSFAALPTTGTRIRGEFKKGNSESVEKCLASCNGCDRVIFGKECLLLDESNNGRIMDASSQIVFNNICKEATSLSCSPGESIFVSREADGSKDCLNRCLNSEDCQYAYKEGDSCQLSPVTLPEKVATIERVCPGLGALESGVLFQESEKCQTGGGTRFKGMNIYQCMGLCLSHPASSCDSIAYHSEDEICELLDSTTFKGNSSLAECLHFTLNIIEGPTIKQKKRLSGNTGKKKTSFPIVDETAVKIPRPEIEKVNLKKRNGEELDVETICSYASVNVKVKHSNKAFKGHLFLRNSFDSCSHEFKEGSAVLKLPLNGTCTPEKRGNLYKAVVVIKEKSAGNMYIITAKERMYTVSCDYSNQNSKINITKQIQIRDMPYNEMDIGSNLKTPKLVEMELRSKREEVEDPEDDPPNHPISLGHPLELAIKQSSKQFAIESCVAENRDGNENITLIEYGCPTLAAKDYIIRGSIQRGKKGFILPMRAFKFRNGNIVRISCVLQQCDNCEKPVCNQRSRRNLASEDAPREEVQAELLIQDHAPSEKGKMCLRKNLLIFGSTAYGLLVLVEVSALFYIAFQTKYPKKFFSL